MNQLFSNSARGYLSAPIGDSTTEITLNALGGLFPVAAGSDWFKCVLQDANGIEIVYCTAHGAGSNTFTVQRGQEGTTARAFAANAVFGQRVTAADMNTLMMLAGNVITSKKISQDIQIPDGYNAVIIGPAEIDPNVTITGLGNSTLRGL